MLLLFAPSWGFNNIRPVEFLPSVPKEVPETVDDKKKAALNDKKNK